MLSPRTLYAQAALHTYLDAPLADLHHRALVAGVLAAFRLGPGDRVLEVGAGSGRYSDLLTGLGLTVVAVEPDLLLFEKLQARAVAGPSLMPVRAYVGSLGSLAHPVDALCGFHLLHHLDEPTLRLLCRDIGALRTALPAFRGWFFLEPNPLNPLYPLQIATTRGMRFREEKGIWLNDYRRIFAEERLAWQVLGHVGLLPPQLARLVRSPRVLRWWTRPRARPTPLALYRLIGHREPGVDTAHAARTS